MTRRVARDEVGADSGTPQEGAAATIRGSLRSTPLPRRDPVDPGSKRLEDSEAALDSLLAYIEQLKKDKLVIEIDLATEAEFYKARVEQLEGERDEARRKYTKALDRIDGIETQLGNFLEPATPSVLSDPDQTSGAASEGNEGALGVAVQRAEAAERENERLREALEYVANAPTDVVYEFDRIEAARAALAARTEGRTDA